jgi:hypothetical protein
MRPTAASPSIPLRKSTGFVATRSRIGPGGTSIPPLHVCNHRTRRDRVGDDPPLILIAPSPPANHARYLPAAPNQFVSSLMSTIMCTRSQENRHRALLAWLSYVDDVGNLSHK